MKNQNELWPKLNYNDWFETEITVHLFTQIIGKIRLALMPPQAEWAQVAFSLTSRGLSAPFMPVKNGSLDINFDFILHEIHFQNSVGQVKSFSLKGISVAEFYQKVFEVLNEFDIKVKINPMNVEMKESINLETDNLHKTYDENAVRNWMQVLILSGVAFEKFRSGFWGKQTPVNFFWGSFDMIQVRFNGLYTEPPAGSDLIYRVAMDAGQSTVGFWPGDDISPEPLYFAYTYPKPEGIENAKVSPSAAFWSEEKGEFFLPYEAVRTSQNPEEELLKFCESTYAAGATLAKWDRKNLERKPPL